MGSLFGGSGNRTTRTAAPDYSQPYLNKGLSEADRLYNQGKQVAPFSNDTLQSQQMIRDRAANGDPTIDAASKYVRDSLNGNFLNSNPYLDKTYDMAAQRSQSQLASQFAGVGRNVSGSQGNRAQQLGDLATQIYGGAYNTDRQLQQGVLPYAQPLGNQSYTDANNLNASGTQQENKQQEIYDAPGQNLTEYLNNIRSGTIGQTTTETQKADPLTSVAGGLTALSGLFGSGTGSDIGSLLSKYGGDAGAAGAAGGIPAVGTGAAAGTPASLAGLGGVADSAAGWALPAAGFGGAATPLAAAGGGGLGLFGGGSAASGIGASGFAGGSTAVGGLGEAGFGGGAAAAGTGSGLMSGIAAAAPWVAAAIGVGAVVANNAPKSSPLNDFNVNSLGWDKAQNFDNTKFEPQELNSYFGPAIQVFAQTGDAQKALAAIPKPTNAREQIMLKGGAKALFDGTGNPFRQIAKAKGFGDGIWTAGNSGKKDAIKSVSSGMFGSPATPRMVA